jgi:hypothetical protein
MTMADWNNLYLNIDFKGLCTFDPEIEWIFILGKLIHNNFLWWKIMVKHIEESFFHSSLKF